MHGKGCGQYSLSVIITQTITVSVLRKIVFIFFSISFTTCFPLYYKKKKSHKYILLLKTKFQVTELSPKQCEEDMILTIASLS